MSLAVGSRLLTGLVRGASYAIRSGAVRDKVDRRIDRTIHHAVKRGVFEEGEKGFAAELLRAIGSDLACERFQNRFFRDKGQTRVEVLEDAHRLRGRKLHSTRAALAFRLGRIKGDVEHKTKLINEGTSILPELRMNHLRIQPEEWLRVCDASVAILENDERFFQEADKESVNKFMCSAAVTVLKFSPRMQDQVYAVRVMRSLIRRFEQREYDTRNIILDFMHEFLQERGLDPVEIILEAFRIELDSLLLLPEPVPESFRSRLDTYVRYLKPNPSVDQVEKFSRMLEDICVHQKSS